MKVLLRRDFAQIVAYLEEAIGVSLTPGRHELYYKSFCDLDASLLAQAARDVVATRQYPTFPTIGELRQAAIRRDVTAPHAIEAWLFILDHRYHTFEELVEEADNSILRSCLFRFGRNNWKTLQLTEYLDEERRRFEKFYDAVCASERERRSRLPLPAPTGLLTESRRND